MKKDEEGLVQTIFFGGELWKQGLFQKDSDELMICWGWSVSDVIRLTANVFLEWICD